VTHRICRTRFTLGRAGTAASFAVALPSRITAAVPSVVVSLLLAQAMTLSACTGSLFKSKATPPTIYVLSSAADAAAPAAAGAGAGTTAGGPAPGTPAAPLPVDLAVLKPRVRIGLESDRIAILYPDRHLDYFADARWSGPLGDVLQDLAVQVFHARANLRTVSGDSSVFASAYWLEIEVTDFQAEYASAAPATASAGAAPTVRVHLLARMGNSGDRGIMGRYEATAQQKATENRLTAIVDAYARAADMALADMVTQATDTLRKSSEAR